MGKNKRKIYPKDSNGKRFCGTCEEWLTLDSFRLYSGRRSRHCSQCTYEKYREGYLKDKDPAFPADSNGKRFCSYFRDWFPLEDFNVVSSKGTRARRCKKAEHAIYKEHMLQEKKNRLMSDEYHDGLLEKDVRTNGLPYGYKKCKKCQKVMHHSEFVYAGRGSSYSYDVKTICKKCNEVQIEERRKAKVQALIDSPTKFCSGCNKEKPKNDFSNDKNSVDGRYYRCKECVNAQSRALWKKMTPEQRENKNRNNKKWMQNKYYTDENFKLQCNIQSKMRSLLSSTKPPDNWTYVNDYIGCSNIHFIEYIMAQGYKKGVSHMDHIIPLSRFDLSYENARQVAFNYRNVQVVDAEENLKKNTKIVDNYMSIIEDICDELSMHQDDILPYLNVDDEQYNKFH